MYSIYVDFDGDVWLSKGNKIHAYASVDHLIQNHANMGNSDDRNVVEVTKRWGMELLAKGNDLQTVANEAKLELLLRQ